MPEEVFVGDPGFGGSYLVLPAVLPDAAVVVVVFLGYQALAALVAGGFTPELDGGRRADES